MDRSVRTVLNLHGCVGNADHLQPVGFPAADRKAYRCDDAQVATHTVVEIFFLLKNQSEVFDEGELSGTHDYASFAAR